MVRVDILLLTGFVIAVSRIFFAVSVLLVMAFCRLPLVPLFGIMAIVLPVAISVRLLMVVSSLVTAISSLVMVDIH